MNDVPCYELVATRDLRVAGSASAQATALGQQLGSGSPVYCAVDATTTEKRTVCCIYDCVNIRERYVADGYRHPFESAHHRSISMKTSADAYVGSAGSEP